ncbi:MAG: DUF7793 family protein [Bacteroidia bacterium]
MIPPPHVKLFDGELATLWFDEHGILCAVAKAVPRSLEMQKANYDFIRQITGGKKVCLLSDTTSSSPQDKETRDYIAAQIPDVFKAMAVISGSASGRFITNVFLAIKQQPIPMRFFSNEADAKEWLKQYL